MHSRASNAVFSPNVYKGEGKSKAKSQNKRSDTRNRLTILQSTMTHEEAAAEQQIDSDEEVIVRSWNGKCYEKTIVITDLKYKVDEHDIDSNGYVKKGAIVANETYYEVFETKKGSTRPSLLKYAPNQNFSVSNVIFNLKQAITDRAKSFKNNTGKTFDDGAPMPGGLNASGKSHWQFLRQLAYFSDYMKKF